MKNVSILRLPNRPTRRLSPASGDRHGGHDGHGSVRAVYTINGRLHQAFTFSSYGVTLAVHGADARDLAFGYGVSLQRIYNMANDVRKAYKAERLPEGWVEATIAAPKNVMREFKRRVAAERRALGKRR